MHPNLTAMLHARRIELVNELVEIEMLLGAPSADEESVISIHSGDFAVPGSPAPDQVRVAAEEVPAIPDDGEPVWLSGHGKVTYSEAVEIAEKNGFTVVVSTGTGGPSMDEQHRIATLQPPMDATNLPIDLQ